MSESKGERSIEYVSLRKLRADPRNPKAHAGEVYAVEVIVAEVNVNAARVLQVIGRPEGALVTAFARTEWREVGS